MSSYKLLRLGLYLSILILLVSVGSMLWPLLSTARFWVGLGIAAGIVGTFLFTVALTTADPQHLLNEEE